MQFDYVVVDGYVNGSTIRRCYTMNVKTSPALTETRDEIRLLLCLPPVCRQIYVETATLAYSTNTFVVPRGASQTKWIEALLPAQRNAITKVHLYYRWNFMNRDKNYPSLKDSGLRNLKNVNVTINVPYNMRVHLQNSYLPSHSTISESWIDSVKHKVKKIHGLDMVGEVDVVFL
jgi:hypothetical protein